MFNVRPRTLMLLALVTLVALSLAGCEMFGTPTPTLPPPTAAPTATIAPPTAPAGWTIHKQAAFQLALPDSWRDVQMDDATLKAEIDAASSDNPHLADTLRGILTSGQNKNFIFFAADAKSTGIVVNNVSVARTTIPGGTPVTQAAQEYAQALPQLLKGAKLVTTNAPLTVNGQDAAEIDYDLPLVNGSGQLVTVRGIQFLVSIPGGQAYVITVSGDSGQADQWTPLARQIGQSFAALAQ